MGLTVLLGTGSRSIWRMGQRIMARSHREGLLRKSFAELQLQSGLVAIIFLVGGPQCSRVVEIGHISNQVIYAN